MSRKCWRELIVDEIERNEDCWENVVGHAPHETEWLDTEFSSGYGGSEGCAFTLWTADRVYFPVVYDGAEWSGSAPRNPCGHASKHQGGQ